MNEGSVSLLLLDSLGDSVGTVGRLGEGPGEFQAMTDLDTKDDQILVLDGLERRVHLFERDSLVTMWSLRGITGDPEQVAFSLDGAPVVSVARRPHIDRGHAMQVLREAIELYRVNELGRELEKPIEILGAEFFVVWNPSGAWRTSIPAFGVPAVYDLTRTGVTAADARDGSVVAFSWAGEGTRTLRPASQRVVPVSEAELGQLWQHAETVAKRRPDLNFMTYAREAVEVWGESVPRPFYSALISDGSETLIRNYAPGTSDVAEWVLLHAGGKTFGKFSLDRNTQLFSIHEREVLGVGLDSLGVEHVVVLRIRDPSGSP